MVRTAIFLYRGIGTRITAVNVIAAGGAVQKVLWPFASRCDPAGGVEACGRTSEGDGPSPCDGGRPCGVHPYGVFQRGLQTVEGDLTEHLPKPDAIAAVVEVVGESIAGIV